MSSIKKFAAKENVSITNFKKFNEILTCHQLWLQSNGEQGQRADFSDSEFENIKFEHYANDLSGAIFKGSNFKDCEFREVRLDNADFSDIKSEKGLIIGTLSFEFCDLNEAVFNDCKFRANFRQCKMDSLQAERSNFHGGQINDCSMNNANLSFADLSYCELKYCDLVEANLSNAKFWQTDLSHSTLAKASLENVDLEKGYGIDFRGIVIDENQALTLLYSFAGADLSKCDSFFQEMQEKILRRMHETNSSSPRM